MSNYAPNRIDAIWEKTLFRFLPPVIKPNHFTYLRFALIPAVLYLLLSGRFAGALLAFALAALADSLDGSLARTRRQTSPFGGTLDPLADKLLVVLTVLFLLYFYPYPQLLLMIIMIEILLGTVTLLVLMVSNRVDTPPANWTGKSKMIFETAGVVVIFFYLITAAPAWRQLSVVLLDLAIFTGILSLFSYGQRALKMLKK